MAFSSATHDIAADGFYMLALDPHEQSLVCGHQEHVLPHRHHSGQRTAHHVGGHVGNFHPPHRLFVEHRFLRAGGILHCRDCLPLFPLAAPPDCDRTRKAVSARGLWKDIWLTVTSFFRKPQPVAAVLSCFFYRLPEALLIRISNLFLIKPVSEGGLGLSTQEVGFVQGTVGVLGLTLGGIIGGIAASRNGLKKVAVADGMEHHATRPCICLSELLPVYEFLAYQRHGIH